MQISWVSRANLRLYRRLGCRSSIVHDFALCQNNAIAHCLLPTKMVFFPHFKLSFKLQQFLWLQVFHVCVSCNCCIYSSISLIIRGISYLVTGYHIWSQSYTHLLRIHPMKHALNTCVSLYYIHAHYCFFACARHILSQQIPRQYSCLLCLWHVWQKRINFPLSRQFTLIVLHSDSDPGSLAWSPQGRVQVVPSNSAYATRNGQKQLIYECVYMFWMLWNVFVRCLKLHNIYMSHKTDTTCICPINKNDA